MRHIGSFASEAQARYFTDFLLSRDIRSHLEPEADRSWSIWIQDEDQIADAQSALTRFQANPTAPEFQKGPEEAARARQTEAEDLEKYRKRVRSGRGIFPKMGGYGVGFVTFTLILVCVSIAAFSAFNANHDWMRNWYISDPENQNRGMLPEVFQGQIWRLFTPILFHAPLLHDPLHLIFNMMWLYQLGAMVEARKSSLFLLTFIAVSALTSNLGQYFYSGPAFLGMSGVVYALAGYAWMQGKHSPASGIYLDSQSVTILLVWLVICSLHMVGPVANAAHIVGLITGVIWGRASAFLKLNNPDR